MGLTTFSLEAAMAHSRDGHLVKTLPHALLHLSLMLIGYLLSHQKQNLEQVNDTVIAGDNTLVSCLSDTTLKTWDCLSDGTCTRTFRQHSDYVTCLAAAEKNANVVASGGLGGEVFVWDIEAAVTPVSKSGDVVDNDCSNVDPFLSLVVRVWDPRTGSKNMKLRGHTDNIRAFLLDSTGRYCLSGSSDSMIRLWDLGQHRCVHSYAVHTDSVWALASTPTFSHVYSGVIFDRLDNKRDSFALHKGTTNFAFLGGLLKEKILCVFQRGGSFLAGNLSFSRARVSLEGSTPAPVYKEPNFTIPGTPAIVQHEILNNRRHVLTKDAAGSVKLWEITRGVVTENYGQVSFDEKKEELLEMLRQLFIRFMHISIPAWFTVDTRLGSLSVHLETPQCFTAEMYSADLNISGKPEDDKVNLARETLKGLLAHWLSKRRQRHGSQASANGDVLSGKDMAAQSTAHSRIEVDGNAENDSMVYPPFEFSTISPPSIVTEESQGGPWRKKITALDATEDEDFPSWVLDCVLNNRLPPRENPKCSFYLHPCEGSAVQILTQGKLSAPRILRMHKVVNYVIEKLVLDKPIDSVSTDGLGGPSQSGLKPWQKLRPSIEILCNNQLQVGLPMKISCFCKVLGFIFF
ncbi:hypothetical protein V6N13_014630 [Hibiscus sabdariffa]